MDGSVLGSYDCPNSDNVTPAFDEDLNGSGYYRVCTHIQNLEDIAITGQTQVSQNICVYPIEVLGPTDIRVKPHPQEGGIWRQCSAPNQGTYNFQFVGSSLNAVIIIENVGINQDLMDMCLVSQNFNQCPSFSSGRIR